jgi:hypothetical protein
MLKRVNGEVVDVDDSYEREKEATKLWLDQTEEGREFRKLYLTDANIDKLQQQILFHNAEVTFASLSFAFLALRDSGQLLTKAQEEAAAKQAATPHTRAGVPMTEAQQRWSEYRQFSETHSMAEVRQRMRTDAGFASFVSKNREREWQQVGDGATQRDGSYTPSSARLRV